MFGEAIDHGPEVESHLADPSGQRRAIEVYPRPGQDLRLAIQRAMVGVLGDRDLGQRALGR